MSLEAPRRLGLLWLLLAGCGSSSGVGEGSSPRAAAGEPRAYAFAALDGRELSDNSSRGRATALLFITTYDPLSQLEAQRLDQVIRAHRPRANAAAIVLEPPNHAVFAEVYAKMLNLSYRLALADPATLAGEGSFGRINVVPTLVVLDAQSREVTRGTGELSKEQIERALTRASH